MSIEFLPHDEANKPRHFITNVGEATLEWCQEKIGGWIEIVYLPNDRQMLVDEEGLIKHLPYNTQASREAGRPIVGEALILEGEHLWK